MRYLALCTDYDGTIAHHGTVDSATIAALEKLRASGRRLLLVTGREIDDLQRVFDRLDLFERVVAENGALIYRPASREERVLVRVAAAAIRRGAAQRAASRRCRSAAASSRRGSRTKTPCSKPFAISASSCR